jgi:O-antigen/teichoic acid export membrane protein
VVAQDGAGGSRAGRSSFASRTIGTYSTSLAVAVLSLVNVLVISRSLGPTGRGAFAFLTAIATLTNYLSTLGIQEANANIAAREPEKRRALATNSVLLAAVLGTTAACTVAGMIALLPGLGARSDPGLRWLALSAIPIQILSMYLWRLSQADYAFAVTNVTWLLPPVTQVVVNVVLGGLGELTVGRALAAWVGGQALAVAILLWYVGRRLAGFGAPNARLARRSLGFGLKSHVGGVMLLGNYRLDQWFVGAMAGNRELGLYSVAVGWAEGLFYLPTALSLVQRPDIVRASPAEAARKAASICRAALLLTIPLTAGVVLLAPFLCVTIFGERFSGSVDDLRLLAPGAFGIVAIKLLGSALTAQGKPVLESAAIGVSFVATIALDIALIPDHGGLGAALASTIAYSVGGLAVAVIFARTLRAHPADFVPRPSDVGRLIAAARRTLQRRPAITAEETPPLISPAGDG